MFFKPTCFDPCSGSSSHSSRQKPPPPQKKFWGIKCIPENHANPRATVTIILLINYFSFLFNKKVKSVPLQAWRCPEGSRKLRFTDFVTTAQDGGKVVSLTHRPPLPPRKHSWYSFLLEAESIPGPQCSTEGLYQWKIPITPLGIEPATFRPVARCHDQLHHCMALVAAVQYTLAHKQHTISRTWAISYFPLQNYHTHHIKVVNFYQHLP